MRKILEAFFRRRNAILLIAFLAVLLVCVATYSRTPQYLSETRFMIPLGREMGASTANAQAAATLLMVMYDDQIATQMEVLNNRRIIEDALANMPEDVLSQRPPSPPLMGIFNYFRSRFGGSDAAAGPEPAPEPPDPYSFINRLRGWLIRYGVLHEMTGREELILACASRLNIARQNDSGVIHARFTHPSPVFAQTFLTKFLEAYENLRATSGTAGSDMPFYADQEATLRASLREAGDRLAAFRREWGLLDIQSQRDQARVELARLEQVINESRAELTQANGFLEALKTDEARREPESILSRVMRDDTGMVHNLRSIAALLARESRLKAEVGPDHPELLLIQREMRELREGLYRTAFSTLEAQALNARIMFDEATKQKAEAEEHMANLEAKSVEMRALESEVDVAGDALLAYGRNREAARVTSRMDDERINTLMIIEPPTRPYTPESPKPMRDIALGVVFSVFLALYYAFFMESFSDVAYTIEAVEDKFPGPALVSVPEVRKRGDGDLPMPEHSLAMLGRKFFYKGKKLSIPKSILVVGSGAKAGATTLAWMLAKYMSRTYNLRILLVNAHLPGRKATDEPPDAKESLSDWLLDRSIVPERCQPGEVRVLAPGVGGTDVRAAMLRTTSEDLASLGADFDVVIFDALPLNADSVSFHLAALTEATLPVVHLEHTRKAVLESMNDDLTMSGASVLGVICNRRRFYIPRWLYKRLS